MKAVIKIVLFLSSVVFFVLLAPGNYLALVLFGLFGICVGIQIGSFDLKSKRLHPIVLIILIPAACYLAYCAGRSFYATWPPFGFLANFSSDPDSFLSLLCHCGSAASIPVVYLLLCEAANYFGNVISILRKEYSIKPLFSSRSAFAKSAGIVILNLAAAVVLGLALITAAYSLPISRIEKNVRKSAEILNLEGPHPFPYSWCTSKLDNYTDAVMLMEAADDSKSSVVDRALMAYKGVIKGQRYFAAFILHYIQGEEYTGKDPYSRYWHGYHLFLNPLLEIMDYGGIRILNGIVQVSLAILVSVLLAKRKASQYILPYICIYLMINPLTLRLSLHFSSCFYLLTFGIIALLLLPNKIVSKYAYLVFLNIGISTAYFDCLTYPIATFGIPAVLYIALQSGDSLEKKLNDLIRCGITWCIGYGGMWASKWIVTYLLTGYNAFADAAHAILERTSNVTNNGSAISKLTCVLQNYKAFLFNPAAILCVFFIVYLIMKIKTANPIANSEMISASIPYMLLAFAPVVWYLFAANHSWLHDYFANKACSVTLMAILCCLADLRSRRIQ